MKHSLVLTGALAAGLLAVVSFAPAFAAAPATPAYITAAIADSSRPKADTDRDADRLPAPTLTEAGIKPGQKVAELLPGGGYMTRLLSKVVGPTGHVYAINLAAMNDRMQGQIKAVAADPAYSNITVSAQSFNDLKTPEPVDVVWTSLNYHDLHNPGMFSADVAMMNKAIFNTLKPGGLYVIIDHAAAAGSGLSATATLHRIDAETTKAEVTAAGFVLDKQSDALRVPSDDHTGHSNDKTDKFFLIFRKPR